MGKQSSASRRGRDSNIRGMRFEMKMLNFFEKAGFKCRIRDEDRRIGECDITGKKEGGWFSNDTHLLAECKDKEHVTLQEALKFQAKFNLFARRHPDDKAVGYLVTTGDLNKDAKSSIREFNTGRDEDEGRIRIKRIRP